MTRCRYIIMSTYRTGLGSSNEQDVVPQAYSELEANNPEVACVLFSLAPFL